MILHFPTARCGPAAPAARTVKIRVVVEMDAQTFVALRRDGAARGHPLGAHCGDLLAEIARCDMAHVILPDERGGPR